MEEETLDEIFKGQLKVFQHKKGYRFSIDALLLSHFITLKTRSQVMELGCGCGINLLILAKRYPKLKFTGLELQKSLALLATKNVQINHLEKNIKIIGGDAREIRNIFPMNYFESVLFNPPYRKLNSGRVNPHPEKAIARHEINGSLEDFLKAARYLLKETGTVFTIYPATRLVELIHLFRKNGFEPKRLRAVFSDMNSEAEFILVEGKKGSRKELKFECPLLIYESDKKYTKEVFQILNELFPVPSDAGN